MERREWGSRWRTGPGRPLPWPGLFSLTLSPARVVRLDLGIERWPAPERLSDLGEAPGKGGMDDHVSHIHGNREDPTLTVANIYIATHPTR